jgi:transcriptional regulator GlxA family with amidase domain
MVARSVASLSLLLHTLQDTPGTAQRGWMEVTKTDPEVTTHQPIEIGIVCYDGSQATSVSGLTDLFGYANYFAKQHASSNNSLLRVSHWRPHAASGELECISTHRPDSPTLALIIVPASQSPPFAQPRNHSCVDWIRQHHAGGAVVAAVCGGVFLLAESGLLAGRRATTHWMFANDLGLRFPEVVIDADRLVIDDGDIITAGGVLAWADLGLSLVERLIGPVVMLSTARFMLVDPPGREQRFYSGFAPRLQHGDKAILSVQHWLQAQSTGTAAITMLAGRAHLSERTFLRRFVKATGLKPSEYQQRLRIARAQDSLQFTRHTVEQIAATVGYEDAGGFRKVFKRVTGLSPAEYRRRFTSSRMNNAARAS